MDMVWEAVLGTEQESDAAPVDRQAPSDDYGAYVGTYLPTHRPAEFAVSEENGRLALLMPPSPQLLELEPPDEDDERDGQASRADMAPAAPVAEEAVSVEQG